MFAFSDMDSNIKISLAPTTSKLFFTCGDFFVKHQSFSGISIWTWSVQPTHTLFGCQKSSKRQECVSLWAHTPSCVCNHMWVGGIAKYKSIIFHVAWRRLANQNRGKQRVFYKNACAHAVYSLPPCASSESPHPNTWNLEWSVPVTGVGHCHRKTESNDIDKYCQQSNGLWLKATC